MKNDDAEERERNGNVYRKRQWDRLEQRRTYRKQQAQRYCLPTLAQLSSSPCFYSTACHQRSPPPVDPAVDAAVHGHVMKGRSPERYLMQLPSHILYVFYYVRAHQHRARLNNAISLMIMLAM